jgi:ribosomal protein S18 acetylase RimI-like enzyme
MTSISEVMSGAEKSGRLRPFDPRRDFTRVADLIELCFADTLDQEGQSYLRHMRAAAHRHGVFRWPGLLAERGPLPLNGFIWEEDNQIVGNLTLIPYINFGHRYYLIANVAVHPDSRRQGIARNLTLAAIDYVRQRGIRRLWLHVREENGAPRRLYQSLGFIEKSSRTTWHSNLETSADLMVSHNGSLPTDNELAVKISSRRAADWPVQQLWLKKLYPAHLTWHLSLRLPALRPGIWGFLYRLFNELHLRHWSAWREEHLIGTVTWQSTFSFNDFLWLAVDPQGDETAVAPLLAHVRRYSSPRRTLALDYPSGQAVQEIRSAGFHEHQTLVWMEKSLNE